MTIPLSIALTVTVISALIYLACDATQRYAAVQELARLAFAVALLAVLLSK